MQTDVDLTRRMRLKREARHLRRRYPEADQKILEQAIKDRFTAEALKSIGLDPKSYGVGGDTKFFKP